jgi:signal transduction histidine kinase
MVTSEPRNESPAVPAASAPGRWWHERLGDLRHAVLGGPDEPLPALRLLRRPAALQVAAIVVVSALIITLLLGVLLGVVPQLPGRWGIWVLTMIVLSLALLLVGVRRPLLAWRIAWLAVLYEVVRGWTASGLPGPPAGPAPDLPSLPPLLVSPVQAVLFLALLFLVAASQHRGVVFWVWLLTVALAGVAPVTWILERGVALMDRRQGGWLLNDPDAMWIIYSHRPAVVTAAVLLVTAVVVTGQLVRHQSRTQRQLAEVRERGLVLDERTRLARELHDVVAHHVSMIAVRAETAPYRLDQLPEQARAEFAEISQASRESLAEMRRLLGVLRSDSPAPTGPQPGLADLADLVEWTRAAGTPITLESHGALAGLPAAVDVSAYRILQEALTNAARHATGVRVHLRLDRTESELKLSVRNGPRQARAGHASGTSRTDGGHGVRGMRERAAMLGGELYAGPTDDGGFEVTATLPLRGGTQ